MNLYINGTLIELKPNMDRPFAKAAELSNMENCICLYIEDDTDPNFDSVCFLDSATGNNEFLIVKFMYPAMVNTRINIKRLFMQDMIIRCSCSTIKLIDLNTLLSIDTRKNPSEFNFIPQKDTLLVYLPTGIPAQKPNFIQKETIPLNSLGKIVSLEDKIVNSRKETIIPNKQKPENTEEPIVVVKNPAIQKSNLFTKKFTLTEKRNAMLKALLVNENVDLFCALKNKSILRVDRTTGTSKQYDITKLIANPNLGLESVDDVINLGIFKATIKEMFKNTTVCDMRVAFKFFKNPESFVAEINFVVNDSRLYIVYADDEIVNQGMSLKELSIKTYTKCESKFERFLDKYETAEKRIFFVHGNELEDRMLLCDETKNTCQYISLKQIREDFSDIDFMYSSDIASCFPVDRIFNLNDYGIEDVQKCRSCPANLIEKCKFCDVNPDGISRAYNSVDDSLYYTKPSIF